MLIRHTGEAIEGGAVLAGVMRIDARAEVAVQGIDDQQAGLGSLERIFQDCGIAKAQRRRLGSAGDSAQQDQAGEVAVELLEARANDFGGSVLG